MGPSVIQSTINLDSVKPGELPSFHETQIAGRKALVAYFHDCTIWLRADQVNELAAKLMVHLPTAIDTEIERALPFASQVED